MQFVLPAKETLEIEFKSDLNKLSDNDLIDAVVAFANTNGGVLYLGIEDDGTVTGLHEKHRDITQLSAFIANKTVPPISVRLELLESEMTVLMISVPKSRSVVASSSGKIQRRRIKADGSPENIPMYPYEIATRLSELSLLDFSSQPVPGAHYSDFDPLERERLRKLILSYNGEKNLLELSDEELDKALRFAVTIGDELVPTYTGLLMIGRQEKIQELMPTAEAAFVMMRGTEVVINESFFLPILSAIEKISDYISARNLSREYEQGMFRISVPDFDKRAVREAVVNAFAHRDYTRLGRVLVKMDEDGLSVGNPGGFIDGVTYDNILSVEPHGRNPVLADALKRIGLTERSGRGVDRIYEGSLIYGKDLPDYSESTTANVKLFIPKGTPDASLISIISQEQIKTGIPMPLNSLLVLNTLKNNRKMTFSEIANVCNIPESKLKTTMNRLIESGLIEETDNSRKKVFVLCNIIQSESKPDGSQEIIDINAQKDRILTYAKSKEYITRKDVVELLNISTSQAYRLLKKLSDEGELSCNGSTRGAKYTFIQN